MSLTAAATEQLHQRYVAAWREIARHREGDWVCVSANGEALEIIVTSVHAGDSPDVRQAYLTGRLLRMPVQVKIDAHNLAFGFYRLANLDKPAA
jgi:hypothetical protein